ncbi:NAD(P)H-dependent oxidoreductase [Streptococcus suis]|nr:NAD(P)H-dependent oxidoreductase [Streptococcus suis]MDN3001820.1 NAD(P)H-dependent oxidoreductase [Streptococcus suis]MDN3007538.1 NAD(P)H-dependent oxidoreductase [Streptococcus suis]MDN3009651.1 NAD(P)H-dependent oxidoreductase [Streptococcus suis]MDW8628004.1 NAD(P)H-dependent oxidoreductase [Streptococcus suis]UUD28045.1 NAD(P)H-dependent oxidoreductase [Streptococcus suis]
MKALIVFAHPRKESFTHALVDRVAEALLENGAEVVIRDLYEIGFDPVLRGEIPFILRMVNLYVRQLFFQQMFKLKWI